MKIEPMFEPNDTIKELLRGVGHADTVEFIKKINEIIQWINDRDDQLLNP